MAFFIKISFLVLIFKGAIVNASLAPQSVDEFCQNHQDDKRIQNYLEFTENLLDFKNSGGVFNQGVCWWHSRFQRNLLTIAYFTPHKEPTSDVKKLLRKIKEGKSVVEIPGFENVEDFSKAYKNEIQKLLNEWQIVEGGLQGGWQRGIKGKTKEPSDKLQKMMDELYHYVEVDNKIAYQKLQMKGIVAHAWLVHRMKKLDDGYELSYLDSNDPKMIHTYIYKNGESRFYLKKYGFFVPYLEFKNENERLISVAKKHCTLI